ncbi:hypothetical protein [Botryobacter ruber]|uniref:hypothetical protein n=1 Tax=Botryobacter ruber TaxID=2171629 RepID=UPI000E0A1F8C|nr:hypothetical protein [Botryobacter ruber]
MKTYKNLLLVAVLLFFACTKENIEPGLSLEQVSEAKPAPGNGCTSYYFYDGEVKVELGNVSASSIVVGFVSGMRGAEKKRFLKEYETYVVVNNTYPTHATSTPEVINLQPGLSCQQVESLLKQLATSDYVRYANPTFVYNGLFKPVYSTFFVILNPKATFSKLEALCQQTNTRIVDASGADWGFYIIEADKYSAGNALEMANYFHEQRIIDAAELEAPIFPVSE